MTVLTIRRERATAVAASLFRFAALAIAMLAVVVGLALVECTVLWKIGINYVPKSQVYSATVADFQFSAFKRWGASRVSFSRKQGSRPIESDILLHDLRRPGAAISLGLGRFMPRQLAMSPQGDWLAFVCGTGRSIHLCSLNGPHHSPRCLSASLGIAFDAIACSPDGQLLAASGDNWVCLWRMPTGEFWRHLRHGVDERCHGVSFSADSKKLLSAGVTSSVLWDLKTGERRNVFSTVSAVGAVNIALAPAGDRLVYTTLQNRPPMGEMRLLDVETGDLLWRAEAGGADRGVAFSADGSLLAGVQRVGQRRQIIVRNAHSGQVRIVLPARECRITGLAFGAETQLYAWDSGGLIVAYDIETGQTSWQFSVRQWVDDRPLGKGLVDEWRSRLRI